MSEVSNAFMCRALRRTRPHLASIRVIWQNRNQRRNLIRHVRMVLAKAAGRLRGLFRIDHRMQGDLARDRKDWISATKSYQAHLLGRPRDAAIWVQLGHAQKEAGRLDGAAVAYSRALALLPLDADLQLNIGHLEKIRGRSGNAIVAYERSAALEPTLFGGIALAMAEQLLARMIWQCDGSTVRLSPYRVPSTSDELLQAIKTREESGRRLFEDYFRSFEMR